MKDNMEFETWANVYEPFEEYFKPVEIKALGNTSAEIDKDMNASLIG